MEKLAVWQKVFIRPEIFVYISPFVFTAVFILLRQTAGSEAYGIIDYYVHLNWRSAVGTLVGGLYLYVVVFWLQSIVHKTNPIKMFSEENFKRQAVKFSRVFRNFVFIGIPFGIAFSSMTLAMGSLNVFNATRLRDELLFNWDVLFTGTFPPLSLTAIHYPAWFVGAVELSFLHLVAIFTLFVMYLFLAHQNLFREVVGAFFLSLFVLFAGWFMFPVLSPHDRFIDNVYNLPTIEAVEPYLQAYRPQAGIVNFLEFMRESKKDLHVFPTTAIPSAHVVWAVFLVYYTWRIHRWLGVAALPIAILSSFGTFFFAQHYFVDFPAGIITAVIAIVFVRYIAKRQLVYAKIVKRYG